MGEGRRDGPMALPTKHNKENSGSIIVGEFLC